MKKFARWSLAFAAVMSFSASALAIPPCIYKFIQSNGIRKIDTGKVMCNLAEQGSDLFFDHCAYKCNWKLPSPYGASVAANLHIDEEVTWENFSCDESALFPATANLFLDPQLVSTGFNTRYQKMPVCRFNGMLDGDSKVVKGIITLGSPLSVASVFSWVPEVCY